MSYRRNTSLKDRVVKTETKSVQKRQTFLKLQKLGSFPCLNCINCKLMVKGDTFKHPSEPIEVKLKNDVTCTSDWVVYIIWCPCNLIYIGQTTCDLKTRLNNHRYTIRKKSRLATIQTFYRYGAHRMGHTVYSGGSNSTTPERG